MGDLKMLSNCTYHLGMFRGAPIIFGCVACDKGRFEASPEVRSSGRVELWSMRAAERVERILEDC
jgi:hypothetical protein